MFLFSSAEIHFSATTLFAGAPERQKNVTLVGEETGGGYYGNTAWIIPDVTLPNTGLRFRLPRFRMVINKDRVKNGRVLCRMYGHSQQQKPFGKG